MNSFDVYVENTVAVTREIELDLLNVKLVHLIIIMVACPLFNVVHYNESMKMNAHWALAAIDTRFENWMGSLFN